MIVFDKVAKRYPNGREALAGVSLRVNPGEMVFLTGKSGAGKSSVLKLIALLERPTRGTVLVNGRNTNTLRSGHIPAFRRNIGVGEQPEDFGEFDAQAFATALVQGAGTDAGEGAGARTATR